MNWKGAPLGGAAAGAAGDAPPKANEDGAEPNANVDGTEPNVGTGAAVVGADENGKPLDVDAGAIDV